MSAGARVILCSRSVDAAQKVCFYLLCPCISWCSPVFDLVEYVLIFISLGGGF